MRFRVRFFSCIFLLLLGGGCRKPEIKLTGNTAGRKVLVLCEGNFMWGNAALDMYLIDSGKVLRDVYKTANGGKPLGDVLQSAQMFNNELYLSLNNSGCLVVLDPVTLKEKRRITGFRSPRYSVGFGQGLWVTDLYAQSMAISDGSSISARKYTGSRTEQMCIVQGKLAVAAYNGWVRFFEPSGTQADSMAVSTGTQWMDCDAEGKLWVLCTDSSRSVIHKLNVATRKEESRWKFTAGTVFTQLTMTKNRDTVLLLGNGIYAMPAVSPSAPSTPAFTFPGANFYGMQSDPVSGTIYVSDAKDYVSNGRVFRIDSRGNLYGQFQTGIIPNGFLFLP
ncbi:MAG: hypothetical protein JNL57_06040 [Bacteroidetes bacterium]|nr:hypothetical protein [Bacteroidota bacterium]